METSPQRLQVSRFGIGQRLWLAFGIVTLCTIAGGAISLADNRAANQQTSALVDVTVPEMETMASIQIALLKAMLEFRTYGLTYTEADYQNGQVHLAAAVATHLELVALCERAALGDLPLARQIGEDLSALSKLAEQTHAAVVAQVRAQADVQDLIEQTTPLFAEHRVKMQAKLATEIAAGEPAETLTGRSRKLAITNRSEQLFMVFVQSVFEAVALRDAERLTVVEKKLQPLRESLQRLRAEHTKPDDQERVDRLLGLIERFGATALTMRKGIADIWRINRDRADISDKITQKLSERNSVGHAQIVGQVAVVESAMVHSLWSIVVCALVSAVVGILASLLLARRIVGPVRRTTVALAQVADGDLTAQLAPGGRDELGLMAAGLNTTVERLRHHRRATGDVAQALQRQAQALTGSSQELSGLAQQTALQATAVAQAAEQVNANVATVATAAEELSASVHDIARSSTEAAQVTTEARQLSQHAQGVIAKLSSSSTQISTVARDIESIAQKTNLLALNATIEAASAGEAGRGFAVVANEVKDLARQTAAATADITRKIQEIQTGTADAVGCLGDIAAIIGKIDGFEQSISAAVQEQAATTDEITRTATAAAQATQDIVGNITQVAKATSSTTITAADIKNTASNLAGQAVQLQALVNAMRMENPSSTTTPQVAA